MNPRAAVAPVVTFYRAIPDCRMPIRADAAVLGTLPARGFQYCEALRSASAFGWYAFPPIDFSLLWDGSQVIWTYDGAKSWYPLQSAQYPGYGRYFDRVAPKHLRGFSPPFLTSTWDPSLIQVWTGLFVESAPDWSVLIRPPANLQRHEGYHLYEGIVESDRWFGPLFTNLRLVKTDIPIRFNTEVPLIQVQPLHRSTYTGEYAMSAATVGDAASFPPEVWSRYENTLVKPNLDPSRPVAAYATAVRKRRKGECPMASMAKG
jgi:hypothetical protein